MIPEVITNECRGVIRTRRWRPLALSEPWIACHPDPTRISMGTKLTCYHIDSIAPGCLGNGLHQMFLAQLFIGVAISKVVLCKSKLPLLLNMILCPPWRHYCLVGYRAYPLPVGIGIARDVRKRKSVIKTQNQALEGMGN